MKKTYLKLKSPVQYIKGIGPKRSSYFKKISVETVNDLLFLVPRRYVDYSTMRQISDLMINDEATILGNIRVVDVQRTRNRGQLVKVLIADDSDSITLKWFNRPDLKKRFKTGDTLLVSGKVTFFYGRQLVNPIYEIINEQETDKTKGTVLPIYPLTEGLGLWDIKRAVKICIDECLNDIEETLPKVLISQNELMPLSEAIVNLHFPQSLQLAFEARRRLVYDEFFFFELILAKRRSYAENKIGITLPERGTLTKQFINALPFKFTPGQIEVIKEISADMVKSRPMNRLLQGDVGAGKTVVALYAMLIAVENGYQATLMAPTEILAEQHFIGLADILKELNIEAELLTSSIKANRRKAIVKKIADGKAKIVFGTHALIEETIKFNKLGIVVVDEQHRFGVMQRAALVNKGINPDFLVLSATPIPRTLALTLYGDLDLSLLKDKPPKRGTILTKIIKEKQKSGVHSFVKKELQKGRQAFVICPLIEKSEKLDLKSVKEVQGEISSIYKNFSVGVIHGRLKSSERIKIMNEFRAGQLDILIATTVVEVGVDIPNASIMLIEHPERFGLAQLHQLRGRIGRGSQKSYCFLVLDRYVATETYERIAYFEKNNDGFALAQKDITLRGPGEILGKRQHGLPDLRIGDLETDKELLFLARDDAFAIISKDPFIKSVEFEVIRKKLNKLVKKEKLLSIG